ncbi:hypothetical protein JCM10207_006344 [Rhodosporidiobolus poonsookiae]
MPVPSLPYELISPILVHLRLSCFGDDAARRSNGLAVALVCKAWHPLGVQIIWFRLRLSSMEGAKRFARRICSSPHIAGLVREIYLIQPRLPLPRLPDDTTGAAESVETRQSDEDANVSTPSPAIPFIWRQCTNLRVLNIGELYWATEADLSTSIPASRTLEDLTMVLGIMPSLSLPQLASLPRLSALKLSGYILGDADLPPATPPPTKLPVARLTALFHYTSPERDVHSFLHKTLDILNSSTLSDVRIVLPANSHGLVDRLFAFPLLDYLDLCVPADESSFPLLERAIHVSHSHPTPLDLCFSTSSGRMPPTELRLFGTSSLSALSAHLPPKLRGFHLFGFHVTTTEPPMEQPEVFPSTGRGLAHVKNGDAEPKLVIICRVATDTGTLVWREVEERYS